MKKIYIYKNSLEMDLLEDLKMSLLNFNFSMIHKILLLLKNHLNYLKDNILRLLFFYLFLIIFFTTCNDGKFKY